MDFEQELQKFVRSEWPLRQSREDAHWALDILVENRQLRVDARDLSLGGLGAALPHHAMVDDPLVVGQSVVITICWPPEEERPAGVSNLSAKVIWLRAEKDMITVGFAFEALTEVDVGYIERYLFSKIIQRHMNK